jgi:hypothetical protein
MQLFFYTGLRRVGDVLTSLTQSPDGLFWAGPGSDASTEDGLLKNTYEDVIAEGVLKKFQLRDAFKLKDSPWDGGRGKEWSAHVERNNSPMAVGSDSAIPVADNQKYISGFVSQKKIMARWRVTNEQLDDTQSREGSYRSSRTENMERMIDDLAFRNEFYLGTDGRAVFGIVDATSVGTTVELNSPGNISSAGVPIASAFGNRFVKKGMAIAAINPSNGQIRPNVVKVTAVNSDGTDVTVSAAPGWTTGDYVVQAANVTVTDALDTAYEKAPWGLTAIIDDGTYRQNYFGVDRSLWTNYQSYVSANTGALSFDLLQRVSDIVNQKLDGEVDGIWSHHSVRRVYILLTQADRRYADAASRRNPDGGTAAFQQEDLTMGSVNYKAIRTLGLRQMFLVDSKGTDFVRYTSEKGKWVSGSSGEILVRDGTGINARHSWEAWYFMRFQLFGRNPGKCARLDALTGMTFVVVRGE